MLAILLCLLTLVPSTTPESRSQSDAQAHASDADAAAIYALTIVELSRHEPRQDDRIILSDDTECTHSTNVKFLDINGTEGFRRSWGSTLEAFVRADQSPERIDRAAILDNIQTLLKDPNIEFIEPEHAMTRSRLALSAIGFNGERSKALVLASYQCGGLCGFGTYFFFERRDGKWLPVVPKGASWSQFWS